MTSNNTEPTKQTEGNGTSNNTIEHRSAHSEFEPEKNLFETSAQEHFNCGGNTELLEVAEPPSRNRMRKNISETAMHASIFETPAKLRSSHDTLDVELSDDTYDSDEEGSDATSSYVGVTTYRSDGAPNEYWDKEFVWGNKNNLNQRTIHPNDRTTHNHFQNACLKLCKVSLTTSNDLPGTGKTSFSIRRARLSPKMPFMH